MSSDSAAVSSRRAEPSSAMQQNVGPEARTAAGIQPPVSSEYSMGSPLPNLPGSMPSMNSVIATVPAPSRQSADDDENEGNTSQGNSTAQNGDSAYAGGSSLPVSSGLTSFFRSFSLSGPPSAAIISDATLQSHAGTVSSGNDSDMLPSNGSPAPSSVLSSRAQPAYRNHSASSQTTRPSSSSSSSASIMSATPPAPPALAGGTQVKRAFSNSSAARRMRKLSNPIPAFLGGSGSAAGSPTSASSPLAASPGGTGESYRNLTPRQSYLRDMDREDVMRTPTQSQQPGTSASPGPGIISSSLGFLSSITSLDRLPSVFSLSGLSTKEEYPRGEDGHYTDLTEDMDLRIEDATGDDEVYNEPEFAMQRAKAGGLEDAATLSTNAYDSFEPEAPTRAGTSTTLESSGGSSSRHALSPFPSNLTYASSSSTSLHDSEGPSTSGLPLSSLPMSASESHHSILDPVTYQALRRKTSEADARRVERERQDRARQLDLLDRLQEQAENPQLRHIEGQNPQESEDVTNGRPRSPLVPQREGKVSGIGLGLPPVTKVPSPVTQEGSSAGVTPEMKKSRRRSLFGRLGFSPSNKSSPSSTAKTSTPPVPQVRLPKSNSVSSFGSTQAAPSFVGSFQAVAEAPASSDGSGAPTPSSSSRITESIGSPQSDISSGAFTTPASTKVSGKKSRYIKTKAKNKSKREFNHLFLAQELALIPPSLVSSPAALDAKQVSLASDLPDTPASIDSPTYTLAQPKAPIGRKASRASQSKSEKKASKEVPPSTWALKFSFDGNYLASAGQDGVIRIWQVISGIEERENEMRAMQVDVDDSATDAGGSGIVIPAAASFCEHLSGQPMSKKDKRNSKISIVSTSTTQAQSTGNGSAAATTSTGVSGTAGSSSAQPFAPVFVNKPIHEWKGHTSDILDISWSKNNFLISSSMDKTVRLWHISRKECLCAFQHPDFVTSIAFHPKDDRYFLSGSLDSKLRLWSIPDKKVHCWTQLPELITSVAFTSDGKLACAGTFVGQCLFFDVRDLAFVAKLHSRSARGKYAKGRKITSIVSLPKGEPSEPERVLVTSNDSRLRLWDISAICGLQAESKTGVPRIVSDRHVEAKYKGHENTSSQIKASFSDDGRYVISGSEDRQCYIWQSGLLDFPIPFAQTSKKGADKSPGCESFNPSIGNDTHCPIGTSPGIVTCAVFAPTETRLTLARGGDPLYESEDGPYNDTGNELRRSASQASSSSSSNPNEKPNTPFGSLSTKSNDSATAIASGSTARGTIIITADDNSGVIRVFRNNAIYSQPTTTRGKDIKSISSSTKEKYFLNGDSGQRRASQISKVSRSTSRIRSSLDRHKRGVDDKNESEELKA